MSEILVVGGGASGLAAALTAARNPKARVTVLERLDRVGKKILSTGNGRCNLSNRNIAPERYLTASPRELEDLLRQMPPALTLGFWEREGLLCAAEEDSGRVYPCTFQASTVLDVLLLALRRRGVRTVCGARVTALEKNAGRFTARTEGESFSADRVILAAGGRAAPALGTDGGGYALARSLGHTVLPLYPCLTPLRCRYEGLPALKGVRVRASASLRAGETLLGESRGEVQLTDYGLSGIPAMELSGRLPRGEERGEVRLDLFPALPEARLRAMLEKRAGDDPGMTLEELFTGLLQKRVAASVLKTRGIGPLSRPAGSLTAEELTAAAGALKAWTFPVTGTLGWDKAQTTGGGVPLDEVSSALESRRQPGVYLTGEMLDAAGDCGGYNLHWAFCTGVLAGRAAAGD